MSPELQAFYDAITLYYNDLFTQLTLVVSFVAGLFAGMAFVVATKMRWF